MKRAAWLTDIHLNFLDSDERAGFYRSLHDQNPDAVLISGDIGEADSIEQYLRELEAGLDARICFVLGNHDFYGGSITAVRARVKQLAEQSSRLVYLSATGVVELTPHTCVVGHDGWADARLGAFESSLVTLNDYFLIQDLTDLDMASRRRRLETLGDESAEHLRSVLIPAVEAYPRTLLVTHVPPFREACWYQGRISNDDWLPHFSCQAAGDAICSIMQSRPDRQLTVLCGHTHGSGTADVLPNLQVITGGATYGKPQIQQVFELA